jgi:hypothetical protein
MHFNFDSVRQILWTLTFAAQLILLVVLLGRDRIRRHPWFTAYIALAALRLMAEVLLAGRMAPLPLNEILLTTANLATIVGLLLVVEVAWLAFAGLQRSLWIVNTIGLLLVAGGVLAVWGPWPHWKDLVWDTLIGRLHLLQLTAQKGELFVDLLFVELGLVVVIFGPQFKAGWRSHTQKIAIGLSTVGLAWLVILETFQLVVRSLQQHPQDSDHVFKLGNNLMNADKVVYLAALVWWIVWLWLDEPGTTPSAPAETTPEQMELPQGE